MILIDLTQPPSESALSTRTKTSLLRKLRSGSLASDCSAISLSEPNTSALGGVFDAIAVAVASGGAVSTLAAAVVVWVRQQASSVKVKVTNGTRTVTVEAANVKSLNATELNSYILALAKEIAGEPDKRAVEHPKLEK